MNDEHEQQAIKLGGQLVQFVCLNPESPADDFEFKAHCHFIPRRGERVEARSQQFEVIRVYYRAVINRGFSEHALTVPTVVCREVPDRDRDAQIEAGVKKLLRDLAVDDKQ